MTDKTETKTTPKPVTKPAAKSAPVKPAAKSAPVKPAAVKAVQEAPKVVKLRNPNLTVRISIPGLDTYERTGIREAVMKTARAWMRARGVTITKCETADTEGDGADVVTEEGKTVKADLKMISITEAKILEHGLTINVPNIARKPVEDTGDKAETPKPKADAKPEAKTKPVKPNLEKAQPEAKAQTAPKDW